MKMHSKDLPSWTHSDPMQYPGFIIVVTFNFLFLSLMVLYHIRKKRWKNTDEITSGHAPQPYNEQSIIGSLMNNPESSAHGGSNVDRASSFERRSKGSKGSKGSKKHSTESSMIISKFGFRKQFGKPDVLGNTSNIYEALIDNDGGSDDEHQKKKKKIQIPNMAEMSAIMANQSNMNID
jgi:hypothetical protein